VQIYKKLKNITLMKHNLMIFAAGIAMAACTATAAKDTYKVSAPLPSGMNGMTAFLVNFDTGEKIDSVTVANDSAIFTGTLDAPALARIIVEGTRLSNLILEPGEITLSGRMATGTPLNDLNISIQNHIQQLGEQFQAAPQDSVGEKMRADIMARYEAYCDSVFQANIDNPIGYSFFLDKANGMSLPELEEFLKAHPSLKSYTRVNKMLEAAKNKAATQPGNKFVDFTIENDSTKQSLSDYAGKGKPVLVDFWASWCGPCIRETKVIKELLEEYGPQGLEVLGVAVWDEPENTLRAIEQHQLPWPQILNAQTVPTDLYGISGIPCIMLIAPDGTILSRDKQEDELRADVKAMMEGTLTPETVKAAASE